jgi:hypothetical protein
MASLFLRRLMNIWKIWKKFWKKLKGCDYECYEKAGNAEVEHKTDL